MNKNNSGEKIEVKGDLLSLERQLFMYSIQYDYYNKPEAFCENNDLFSHSMWEILSSIMLFVSLLMPYVVCKLSIIFGHLLVKVANRLQLIRSKMKDSDNQLTDNNSSSNQTTLNDLHTLNRILEDEEDIETVGGFCKTIRYKVKYMYILTLHNYKKQTEERQLLILLPFMLWEWSFILNLYHHVTHQHTYKFQYLITMTYWLLLVTLFTEIFTSTTCALMLNVKFNSFSTWEATVEAGAGVVGSFAPIIYAVSTNAADGPTVDWFILIALYILLLAVNRHLSTVMFNGLIPRTSNSKPYWNKINNPLDREDLAADLSSEGVNRSDFLRLSRKLSAMRLLLNVKLIVNSCSSLSLLIIAYLSPMTHFSGYAYMFQLTAILVLVHTNSIWLVKYHNDLVSNAEETYDMHTSFKITMCGRVVDRSHYFLIAAISSVSYCLRAYLTFNVTMPACFTTAFSDSWSVLNCFQYT